MKLASRRRRIALPGGGAVSAVVALPPGFRRPGRTPAVILAHGAGSDMTNPFLSSVHAGLAREGLVAVKFNFPYTEARRRTPDPRPVLQRCYRAVVEAVLGDRRLRLPRATLHTIEGGDHSFRVPRRAGRTDADVWAEIVAVAARWLGGLVA